LRQPVVRARGESLCVDDILLTLGTRLKEDSAQFFAFPTVENYLTAAVSKVSSLAQAGALPMLREQGVWFDPTATPQRVPPTGFATASGKVELAGALAALAAEVRPSPTLSDLSEGTSDLTMITYRPNVHSGEYSANCWWLAEIAHSNALLINPISAQRRGIQQGQRVNIVSIVGSVEARVRITQGIHPQVVALAAGFGHSAVGRIARAESFKSDDPMTLQVWWEKQGNGVNANEIIPVRAGESGSGQVWMDTPVRIES
jgi:thiosulfate reductase/polysulfide reductase chain A